MRSSIYDNITPEQRELIILGRKMMDFAITCEDDEKSNQISKLGYKLVSVGATFGVRVSDFTDADIKLIEECHILFKKREKSNE